MVFLLLQFLFLLYFIHSFSPNSFTASELSAGPRSTEIIALDSNLILNISHAKARFRDVFSASLRLAISDSAFQHDFPIFALDADIGGIHIVGISEVLVDVLHDSIIRTPIALGATSCKRFSRLVHV